MTERQGAVLAPPAGAEHGGGQPPVAAEGQPYGHLPESTRAILEASRPKSTLTPAELAMSDREFDAHLEQVAANAAKVHRGVGHYAMTRMTGHTVHGPAYKSQRGSGMGRSV